MAPNSRESLIEYALRRLGKPVIEINVDCEQLEDRLDEALEDLLTEDTADELSDADYYAGWGCSKAEVIGSEEFYGDIYAAWDTDDFEYQQGYYC